MLSSACSPTTSGQVGTSRQPTTSRAARCSRRFRIFIPRAISLGSGEKNTRPEAKWSASLNLHSAAISRRNGSGNCNRIPHPSPDLPSAATAPRWVRRARHSNVVSTSQWLFWPSICVRRAKPQLSLKSDTGSCNVLILLDKVSPGRQSNINGTVSPASSNLSEILSLWNLIF